jgi:hypothetical protein
MPLARIPHPATVLAFAALVISLTGSAIAAKKYVITSTKQIKPSVLAQLKGQTGPAGPKGDTGATGAKGDTGATGAKGDTGAAGTNGTNGTNGTDGTNGGTTSKQTDASEVTTTSTTFLDLGGPSITLTVPDGGAPVAVTASAEAKNSGGSLIQFGLFVDGAQALANACTFSVISSSYVSAGGGCILPLSGGSHTFAIRYKASANNAFFQNRTLSVTVLG